jgi:hypothetical protein
MADADFSDSSGRHSISRNRKKRGVGDVGNWVALDSETNLVPTFAVGDRSGYMADMFIEDLASRLSHAFKLLAMP